MWAIWISFSLKLAKLTLKYSTWYFGAVVIRLYVHTQKSRNVKIQIKRVQNLLSSSDSIDSDIVSMILWERKLSKVKSGNFRRNFSCTIEVNVHYSVNFIYYRSNGSHTLSELWKTYGKLNIQGIYKTLDQNICNKCFKLSSLLTTLSFVNWITLCQPRPTLFTTLNFVNHPPLCQPRSILFTTLNFVNNSQLCQPLSTLSTTLNFDNHSQLWQPLSTLSTKIHFVNHPPLWQSLSTLSTKIHFVNHPPLCQPPSTLLNTLNCIQK